MEKITKELEAFAIHSIAKEMARKVANAGFSQIQQVRAELYSELCAENNFYGADCAMELEDLFDLCQRAESMGII